MELNKYELFEQGLYIERMTPARELANLVKLLRPVKTGFELTRYGSDFDGGYLLPDDLDDIAACFSPGVDINASFEIDLGRRTGIHSHLADYSIDHPPSDYQPLSFFKRHLGAVDNEMYMTLDSWVRQSDAFHSGRDLLLQMDIEGGEYQSFLGVSEEVLQRFRVIVVEIHNIESWGQPQFFQLAVALFAKLIKHFHVVHNHPNNCCGLVNLGGFVAPRVFELTLLRKDRAEALGYCETFPHPLDRHNLSDHEELTLPANWFSNAQSVRDSIMPPHDFHFLKHASGVVHIGANTGQEREIYDQLGLRVIWVEPIPEVFMQLEINLSTYPLQQAYQYLLTDKDDVEYEFRVTNNGGESSSIFDLAEHKKVWPDIKVIDTMTLSSKTFATMIKENKINLANYDVLIMDTQGAELLVMQGAGDLLSHFRYIKTEAADGEFYTDSCQLNDLSDYLSGYGFREIDRHQFTNRTDGGNYYDVIYAKSTHDETI